MPRNSHTLKDAPNHRQLSILRYHFKTVPQVLSQSYQRRDIIEEVLLPIRHVR